MIYFSKNFILAAAILSTAVPSGAQSYFETIPCSPQAISADGRYIASGNSRWSREDGFISIGHLPYPYDTFTWAFSISENGSVIVGYALDEFQSRYRAFRWTLGSGITSLHPPHGPPYSMALGVSADGRVIVGDGAIRTAARWEFPGPMTPIGDGIAWGCSGDGSVIVGVSDNGAFRWTAEDGMTYLGKSPENSIARAVSLDGSTIVGSIGRQNTAEAFRYTTEEGMVGLGHIPNSLLWTEALAVSADGSVIVGVSYISESNPRVFVWSAARGMRLFNDVLLDHGLDVNGWTFTSVAGISADGRTIAGSGLDPDGVFQGWRVYLGDLCAADFNADSAINSQDFFDFLNCFFLPDTCKPSRADFNRDGLINTTDFFNFLSAFFTGCA